MCTGILTSKENRRVVLCGQKDGRTARWKPEIPHGSSSDGGFEL